VVAGFSCGNFLFGCERRGFGLVLAEFWSFSAYFRLIFCPSRAHSLPVTPTHVADSWKFLAEQENQKSDSRIARKNRENGKTQRTQTSEATGQAGLK